MAGVLFIVTVPRKEREEVLRKAEKSASLVVETEKDFLEKNNGLKYPVESYQTIDNALLAKCKSTDCLHENTIGNSLFKSRSEIALSDVEGSSLGSDYKSYLKSSWSDLKQVIRPRRNKLKISTPQKGLDILAAFHSETPLEIIVTEVLKRLEIKNAAWTSTRNKEFWQVIFSLESSTVCEETLQVLRTLGVGSRHQSSMSVIPCNLYYKSSSEANDEGSEVQSVGFLNDNNTAWSRFTSSVRARTNLAQVLHDVRADAALTFDWLFLLIVAAFVSAIGLVENSTVILVASMLISPLMGPITAGTLGTAVKDCSLQHLGVLNELLGLLLSLVIGFIFGMAICAVDERYGIGDWPTNEMMSRCEIRSLWIGVLVAIPSGAGVALAVLGDYTASLVGVAISASLLPPAVNAGLLWAMALVHLIFLDDETRWTGVITSCTYSKNPAVELAVLGTISLCLTLVNIVCIFLAGVAIYKVKEVSPLERRDISWWKANRSLLETSKLNKYEHEHSQVEPPANWNKIFQSWCTMPGERKFEKEKSPDPELQSDTITFRRQRLPNAKPTAPNMAEAYLHRNIANLGRSSRPSTASEANADNNRKEKEYNKNVLDSTYVEGEKVDYSGKFDFHNLGYQEDFTDEFDDDVEGIVQGVPTIEPSSNCTVDVKPVSLCLASKSFHV